MMMNIKAKASVFDFVINSFQKKMLKPEKAFKIELFCGLQNRISKLLYFE